MLNGKGGADTMTGLAGNDTYYVDMAADQVVEAAGKGTDQVLTSVSFTLGAGAEVEALRTTDDAGTAAISLYGNDFAQTITGNAGGGFLKGNGGNDVIAGNGGADAVHGGLGLDTLRGGAGNDSFVFDTAPAANNVDTIADYANLGGNNDTIRLENAVFTALAVTGFLAAGAFQANATGAATQADDRIILETDTGKLFYDANGSTVAGDGAQFATISNFASLSGPAALAAADFIVA